MVEARHLESEGLTATTSAKFLNCKTHFPRFDHIAGGAASG
jgi:hypothetical protein